MTTIGIRLMLPALALIGSATQTLAQTAPTPQPPGVPTPESAYNGCRAAYEAQDYADAVKRCREAAKLGSAKGQNGLATLYLSGQGVPKNLDEAVKWFGKAAAQDDPQALNNLATLYFNGEGVAQDRPKAVTLLRRAAALGNTEATNNLAAIYEQFPSFKPQ